MGFKTDMEKYIRIQNPTTRVAAIVGAILLIPLFGNIFIEGWNWDVLDFIVMGTLLFCTGLAISFASRKITTPTYRAFAIGIIVLALIAVWTELAVGAVSQLIQFLLG